MKRGAQMSSEGACHQKSRRRAVRSRLWRLLFVPLVVAAAMLGGGPRQLAQAQTEEGAGVRHLVVTLNKSRTLRFDQPFSSAVEPQSARFVERHHEVPRSEEHTSELQSQSNLVCRLLLEK